MLGRLSSFIWLAEPLKVAILTSIAVTENCQNKTNFQILRVVKTQAILFLRSIRLFPTLISKLKWLGPELPLSISDEQNDSEIYKKAENVIFELKILSTLILSLSSPATNWP